MGRGRACAEPIAAQAEPIAAQASRAAAAIRATPDEGNEDSKTGEEQGKNSVGWPGWERGAVRLGSSTATISQISERYGEATEEIKGREKGTEGSADREDARSGTSVSERIALATPS